MLLYLNGKLFTLGNLLCALGPQGAMKIRAGGTGPGGRVVKYVFSKKASKIDEIFTVDLTVTLNCQIDGDDFVNFCGLLRKH